MDRSGRHAWLGKALAFGFALAASAALAEPAGPPLHTKPLPSQLVDLTGVGYLDFTFDEQAFAGYGPALERSPADLDVDVDASGKVVACSVSAGAAPDSAAAGRSLCAAILHSGKARIPPWYAPAMAGGRIAQRLYAARTVVPQRPIRFVDPPQGTPLTVMDFQGHCIVIVPSLGSRDRDAVCAAFVAAGRPHLETTGAVAKLGLAIVEGEQPYHVWNGERIADRGAAVDFGVTLSIDEHRLGASDGQLTSTVGPMDYPARALREELEGRVLVLIGYDRTGEAQSCRPMRSANSSYLGNASCAVLVRKTRFAFLPSAPMFDGLRYRAVPIDWVVPRD